MSDDVELEEVVALRECRAELEHLQVEYDTLDAHHHKYATWAAREFLRSEKRGDTYRNRALALMRRVHHLMAQQWMVWWTADAVGDWEYWQEHNYPGSPLNIVVRGIREHRDRLETELAAERQAREAAEENAATLSAAHLERCEKVRELQVECDVLRKKAADWNRVARDNQQMAIEYEARAKAAEARATGLAGLLNEAEEYAWHEVRCLADQGRECTCGYLEWREQTNAALAQPDGAAADETGDETR